LKVTIAYQPVDSVPDMKQPHWDFSDPKPFKSIVRYHDGKPAAVLRLFDVSLNCRYVQLTCVGIGGVWVRESLRNKGVGLEFMSTAVQLIGNTQPERVAILLFSPERSLYQGAGFYAIKKSNPTESLWAIALKPGITIIESDNWEIKPDEHF